MPGLDLPAEWGQTETPPQAASKGLDLPEDWGAPAAEGEAPPLPLFSETTSFKEGMQKGNAAFLGAYQGMIKSGAGVLDKVGSGLAVLDEVQKKLSDATGVDRGTAFLTLSSYFMDRSADLTKAAEAMHIDPKDLVTKYAQDAGEYVGSAMGYITQLVGLQSAFSKAVPNLGFVGPSTPATGGALAAAEGALEKTKKLMSQPEPPTMGQAVGETAKAAGYGLLTGALFQTAEWMNKLPISNLIKAPAMGAAMGGFAKASGLLMDNPHPSDIAFQAIMGTLFGFLPGGKVGGEKLDAMTQKSIQEHGPLVSRILKEPDITRTANFRKVQGKGSTILPSDVFEKAKTEILQPAVEAADILKGMRKTITKPEGNTIEEYVPTLAKNFAALEKAGVDININVNTASKKSFAEAASKLVANAEVRFRSALREQGIEYESLKKSPIGPLGEKGSAGKMAATFFNRHEFWDRVQMMGPQTGTTYMNDLLLNRVRRDNSLVDLAKNSKVIDSVKALQKTKATNEDITRWVQYVETTPEGPIWNEAPLKIKGKVDRPAFPKDETRPSPDQLKALYSLRSGMDYLQSRGETGYVQGYWPFRSRLPMSNNEGRRSVLEGTYAEARPSVQAGQGPRFTRARTSGKWSELYETDPELTMHRYLREVANHETFTPEVKNRLARHDLELRLLGRNDLADKWAGDVAEGLGLRSGNEARELYLKELQKGFKPKIDQLLAEVSGENLGLFDTLSTMANDVMYSGYIGVNPLTLMKQSLNPEQMAPGEVGLEHVAWARGRMAKSGVLRMKMPEVYKKALADAEPSLFPKGFELQALEHPNTKLPKAADVITKILTLPGKPGEKAFMKMEPYNRKVSFLAGFREMMESKNPLKLGDSLLDSEWLPVRQQLETGNRYGAALQYGITRSNRINGIYDFINRPEFFKGDMGGKIPFVTWSNNALMRYLTANTRTGLYTQRVPAMLKRLVYPMLAISMIEAVTGKELKGFHPLSGIVGLGRALVRPTTSPLLQDAVTKFDRYGWAALNPLQDPKKFGLSFIYLPYDRAGKLYQRTKEEGLMGSEKGGFLGIPDKNE